MVLGCATKTDWSGLILEDVVVTSHDMYSRHLSWNFMLICTFTIVYTCFRCAFYRM